MSTMNPVFPTLPKEAMTNPVFPTSPKEATMNSVFPTLSKEATMNPVFPTLPKEATIGAFTVSNFVHRGSAVFSSPLLTALGQAFMRV